MKVNKKVEELSISEKRSLKMGERIRQCRKKLKWNQQKLADFLGKSDRSSISYIEKGESNPSIEELLRMSIKFKVPPSWLAAMDVILESGYLQLEDDQVLPVVRELNGIEYQVNEKKDTQLPKGANLEDLRSSVRQIESFLKSFEDEK